LKCISGETVIFDAMTAEKKYILDKAVAAKKLKRMAYEILENNTDEDYIVLAGIRESGSVVARNIQQLLAELSPIKTELIMISLDKHHPKEVTVSKEMDFTGKIIVVIDDVTNSGKTLLYALKPLLAYLPKKIQTLVLVERSHKTFPVHPDYVGLSMATTPQEHIYVEVDEKEVLGAFIK
jgi:pyrimidine operon attenuation protein / uracil phosphoribosyltransferase